MKFSVPYWGCWGIPPIKFCDFTRLRGRRSSGTPVTEIWPAPGAARWGESISELLVSIFCHGFRIMAVFAERLPVAPIPEQFLVTTMGNDVVNHRGTNILTTGKTADTQGVCLEECFAFSPPSAAVPTLASGSCCFWVHGFVFLAVHRTVGDEPCTTGVFAWCVRTMRHGHSSQERPALPKCP